MSAVEAFRSNLLDAGVLDPEGVHHEFVSGMHGQKLDFDKIETGSELYDEWVDVTADYISEKFPSLPDVIVGVANGTNRLALDVARKFDDGTIGAVSTKNPDNSKELWLSPGAFQLIRLMRPEFVVVVEDVGTTGSNSVQVAREAYFAGAEGRVEVLTTWKRRAALEKLEEVGLPYRAIIDEPLPTFEPEACRAEGFCAKGWEFIPRGE